MPNRITQLAGRAISLRGDDIDTDQIISSRYLKWITFEGLERHVFEDPRQLARAQGQTHPFDDPAFAGASILLVDGNFGCGSSREHAPQALYRWGVRAIVGISFGEIFAGNCLAIGMPCVSVAQEAAHALQRACEDHPETPVELDLEAMTVRMPGAACDAAMRAGPRQQLLDGSWDAVAVLLAAADRIKEKITRCGL